MGWGLCPKPLSWLLVVTSDPWLTIPLLHSLPPSSLSVLSVSVSMAFLLEHWPLDYRTLLDYDLTLTQLHQQGGQGQNFTVPFGRHIELQTHLPSPTFCPEEK